MLFSESAILVDVKQHKNYWPMIPESHKNKYSIWLSFGVFQFLFFDRRFAD